MIISFRVGNYLSFKEKNDLMFTPKSIRDNQDECVFKTKHTSLKLLKGGAIIGANASGKSNILKALAFMRNLVLNSWHTGANDSIDVEQFKLNPKNLDLPSYFEIEFLINDIIFRYGFEVFKTHIEKEWLYYKPKKTEKRLFERKQKMIFEDKLYNEGLKYKSQTRENALYLSTVAQYNGQISLQIRKWFKDLVIISDTNYADTLPATFSRTTKNSEFKNYLKKIVNLVDLGFEDIEIIPVSVVEDKILNLLPENVKKQLKNQQQLQFKTIHKRYDSSGNTIENVYFDLMKEESQGTIKYISLAGPIVECLMEGKPLLIDELDSRLHPHLSSAILKIFNSKNENPNNSQIIFTTHNHNFLEEKILRRDQVFFMEKNIRGETTLNDFLIRKKVRNDASYKKDYDLGKYGGNPKIKADQLSLFN